MSDYEQFLARKAALDVPTGFEPAAIELLRPPFDFQRDVINWAVRRGRAALFEDCGLGKTMQQLAWAQQVSVHGLVLILAPLAVAPQTVAEGVTIGIEVRQVSTQEEVEFLAKDGCRIFITNYDKLHRFKPEAFAAIVLDESSILKAYDGKTRKLINDSFKATPYKLACTATPAPNDYMELGNHAEFLGVMTREEMLSMFFTHDGGDTSKWRLKGHAESEFWRWLCSWAVNLRRPSDLGYPDGAFKLPQLHLHEHIVESGQKMDGYLFALPASSLAERREARKSSLGERVEKAINIIKESWAGNLNTTRTEGGDTAATQNGSPSKNNTPGHQKKTKSTCSSITPKTKTNGQGEHGSSKTPTINQDGTNTQLTRNTETQKRQRSESIRSEIQESEKPNESENTDSQSPSLSPFLNTKEESAPSAEAAATETQGTSQWSITATEQTGLEGCSACPATKDSESSKTIQTYSSKLTSISDGRSQWIVWCNLDSEQRALEKALGDAAFSIYGSLKDYEKERCLAKWINGERPVLIGKPSMMAHGLNLQQCHNELFVGLSDSYEQFYQAVRRCWRFGQKREVNAHLVISNLEGAVLANLKRKEADSVRMAEQMVKHMADISSRNIRGVRRDSTPYQPQQSMSLPQWLAA